MRGIINEMGDVVALQKEKAEMKRAGRPFFIQSCSETQRGKEMTMGAATTKIVYSLIDAGVDRVS